MLHDVRNNYFEAPCSEKNCALCGAEFVLENIGKVVLIRRTFYGGKVANKLFGNQIRL